MKKFFKNQFTFLLFGFAFWLPVAVIIFILILLLSNAEEIGRRFLIFFDVPPDFIHPGFGVVLGILIIYLSGLLLKLTGIGRIFSAIPVLGVFFGGGEIMTVDRLIHLQPCVFALSPTCLSYGWILSEEKVSVIDDAASYSLLNVYYPNVPTLLTGQVFPVRKETVIRLGNSSKEIIDLLLYAFRSPKDLKFLPWENETRQDFVERAKSFGLNIPDKTSANIS